MEIILDVEYEPIPDLGARKGDTLLVDFGDRKWPVCLVRHLGPNWIPAVRAVLPYLYCRTRSLTACAVCEFSAGCPMSMIVSAPEAGKARLSLLA